MPTDLIRRVTRELGRRLGGPIEETSAGGRACLRIPLAGGRELRVEQHGHRAVLSMQTSISIPRPLSFDPTRARFDEAQPAVPRLNADERLRALLRELTRGAGSTFSVLPGYRDCQVQAETTTRRWGGLVQRLGLDAFVEAVERLELLLNAEAGPRPEVDMDQIFNTFGELFGDFFGTKQDVGRGEDLKLELDLDPLEAAGGCEKPLTYQRTIRCPACEGQGSEPGAIQRRCGSCNGQGKRMHKQGFFVVQQTCPDCGGRGQTSSSACAVCRGEGRLAREQQVRVTVPPGLAAGSTLRLKGMGNQSRATDESGHLYVELRFGAGLGG